MKRYVILSTNANPDYYFFAPYAEKAWNKLGWDVCIMLTHDVNPNDILTENKNTILVQVPKVEGLRVETVAQASRLYAANYLNLDALLMTCDMDLIPLRDYWKPDPGAITVYGFDLTWRKYIPMGYVAMSGHKWKEKMMCTYDTAADMLRDANETKIAFSDDWNTYWNFDWDLLTKRLMPFKNEITFIDRGQVNIAGATLAKGRVDRYNWQETMKQAEWIDAHCHNNNVKDPGKMEDFLSVFEKVYGKL